VQLASLDARHALRGEATRYLTAWRREAANFILTNPQPNVPHTIADFVQSWQARAPQGVMSWPDEWPLLELCFKLITWMPFLHDDPEGQVYLEAISRVIAQAATFSLYRSTLVFSNPVNTERSVRHAIMDILAPIAENGVDLDEEIMPSVPRDRLSFMTIHQAKGLEYPLVIVDVSSDYSANNHLQRFRRFPESPSNVAAMEDDLANYCPIGPLRMARSAIDRTFDDLVRLYYVAYSRPQSVLMLVGLAPCLRHNTTIKHVAMGWRRNSTWPWRVPVTGRHPALANNIPIHLI
jgi:DNA helicase-2/ATP-dependent DNA helicase PcrA